MSEKAPAPYTEFWVYSFHSESYVCGPYDTLRGARQAWTQHYGKNYWRNTQYDPNEFEVREVQVTKSYLTSFRVRVK